MKRSSTVFVLLFCAVLFVIFIAPRVLQVEDLKGRSRALEAELQRLQKENLALEMEMQLLRDDPVYLEKVARRKFNKAKENEIVYKVVREGDLKPQ